VSQRAVRGVAAGLAIAAGTLALLVVLEAAAFVVLRALAARDAARPLPERGGPAYAAAPWADIFWTEQRRALAYDYHPYGLWRSRPFHGETINVDAEGRRRTHHVRCEPDAPAVWVFGGSTVWGYGSPDWLTVPSRLAERYAATGRPACVVNYGEDSWRAAQGVVKLLVELRRGVRPPDVVVFLNGCNDVFTPTLLTGRVDTDWDFASSKRWLEELSHLKGGTLFYLDITNTMTLARRLALRLRGPSVTAPGDDVERLGREVRDEYVANLTLTQALGQRYGFVTAFLWQPLSVIGGKRLTGHEEAATRRQLGLGYDRARAAAAATARLLREVRRPGLYDTTDVFDGFTGEAYIDACHLTPEGNRRVAERLHALLAESAR
jgi:lysophospholipase L1-like esterase